MERLDAELMAGLEHAASLGLVQITEAGMHDWAYYDSLLARRESGRLECRVRILVADGLAAEGMRERTFDTDIDLIGVKFYADGWLGPRTCALCGPFADVHPEDDGVLFLEPLGARPAGAEAGGSRLGHRHPHDRRPRGRRGARRLRHGVRKRSRGRARRRSAA